MKKFFTSVILQPAKIFCYKAVDNTKLKMEAKISFPILTAINGYVRPGEEFRLFAVMPDLESTLRDGDAPSPELEALRHNLDVLSAQLEALCRSRGLSCPEIEPVLVENSQTVSAQAATFRKLLDYMEDDDELFCCMSFGTKPQSQALVLAVQYAYRVKRNVSISCIVYGEVKFQEPDDEKKAKVYDMTALVRLDEVVHLLAQRGVADPRGVLDAILSE